MSVRESLFILVTPEDQRTESVTLPYLGYNTCIPGTVAVVFATTLSDDTLTAEAEVLFLQGRIHIYIVLCNMSRSSVGCTYILIPTSSTHLQIVPFFGSSLEQFFLSARGGNIRHWTASGTMTSRLPWQSGARARKRELCRPPLLSPCTMHAYRPGSCSDKAPDVRRRREG